MASVATQPSTIQNKAVRFHPSAKSHNGLRLSTRQFIEFMNQNVLVRPSESTKLIPRLARKLDVGALIRLQLALANLIWRCDRSPRRYAYIVKGGGGGTDIVKIDQVPYLTSHVEYLEKVIGRVRTRIARNEAKKAESGGGGNHTMLPLD